MGCSSPHPTPPPTAPPPHKQSSPCSACRRRRGEGDEGAAGADAAHTQVAQLRQDQLRSGVGGQYVERGVDFAHQSSDVGWLADAGGKQAVGAGVAKGA